MPVRGEYRFGVISVQAAAGGMAQGEELSELGWFTNSYLLEAHPTPLLFLAEISEDLNASSLVPLPPMPGAFARLSMVRGQACPESTNLIQAKEGALTHHVGPPLHRRCHR